MTSEELIQSMRNKGLNLKSLEEYLLNIFKDKKNDKQIRIRQHCITQGWIERIPGVDLKICNNPECVSCSFLAKEVNK